MRKLNITLRGCIFFICIGFLAFATTDNVKAQNKGADLSWVTQMESSGYRWKDANGNYGDIFAIAKGLGINGCRLRVWVNPSGGWNGKDDVIAKARRAKDQGMALFIDFHFSDSWADPGQQNKPGAWSNHNINQLYTDVYNHVRDVVSGLISAGCTPDMVQIGNETNDGLLWPEGRASTNPSQYAGLINSGYNAVKSVCNAPVVVHLANGQDNGLFRWNIDILWNNGAQFDAIGMSLYPSVNNWSSMVSQCRNNMNDMRSRYNKWTMLCEIGIASNSGSTGASFVKAARGLCNDVYYWEPEAYNWQGYGLGAWDGNTQQPTVILTDGYNDSGSGNAENVSIRNRATGLYIDGMGRSSLGDNAGQWSGSSSNNQKWTMETSGSNVKFKNVATGRYLDGMGGTSNGSLVGQWESSGSWNQLWTVETTGNYRRIKNAATGLYIDGMGWSSNGSDLGQWGGSGSNNQQWTITNSSAREKHGELSTIEETIEEKDDKDIALSPNPFTYEASLKIDNPEQVTSIVVYDMLGKPVEVIDRAVIKNEQTIGSLLSIGMYVVKVRSTDNMQSFKIIKK